MLEPELIIAPGITTVPPPICIFSEIIAREWLIASEITPSYLSATFFLIALLPIAKTVGFLSWSLLGLWITLKSRNSLTSKLSSNTESIWMV